MTVVYAVNVSTTRRRVELSCVDAINGPLEALRDDALYKSKYYTFSYSAETEWHKKHRMNNDDDSPDSCCVVMKRFAQQEVRLFRWAGNTSQSTLVVASWLWRVLFQQRQRAADLLITAVFERVLATSIALARDVRNRHVCISVRFRFGCWKKLGFGAGWVLFGLVQENTVRFGSDITVSYYSCNSGVVKLVNITENITVIVDDMTLTSLTSLTTTTTSK